MEEEPINNDPVLEAKIKNAPRYNVLRDLIERIASELRVAHVLHKLMNRPMSREFDEYNSRRLDATVEQRLNQLKRE